MRLRCEARQHARDCCRRSVRAVSGEASKARGCKTITPVEPVKLRIGPCVRLITANQQGADQDNRKTLKSNRIVECFHSTQGRLRVHYWPRQTKRIALLERSD